jgi:hypothetical protein
MGYKMKRGAAPKFKDLGSSPAKYEKDAKEFRKRKSKEDLQAKVNTGPRNRPIEKVDLTKTPVGPIAEKKEVKDDRVAVGKAFMGGDIKLDPGFEDIEKIQTLQRKGLTPYSQTFAKRK